MIRYLIPFTVLLLQFFSSIKGNQGVDLSQRTSSSSFQCLKTNGYNFVVVRAYRSNGVPDFSAPPTITNARAAGFQMVDAYMFPCPKCGNPQKQVERIKCIVHIIPIRSIRLPYKFRAHNQIF